MNDFLFRMVERAAGVATAATPQPPRTFQWLATAERLPSHYPAISAWETQASPMALESLRNVYVQSSPQPSLQAASSFEPANALTETSQPLIQPSLAVQSKPHRDVKADATKEATPHFQDRLLENTEQTGQRLNVSHLTVEAAPSKRQPLARHPDGPVIAAHETAHLPLEEPAHKTSISTVQSATPLPRESRAQTADVRTPKPAPEPPVEVKIGRVEIHFDAPATPAASPAATRPGGFSEYAELRRYASHKR